MLAFMIQCHKRLDRVRRLVEWLGEDSLILVVVDKTAGHPLDYSYLAGLASNVRVLDAVPTLWGGASIVHSTLLSMKAALDMSGGWSHFLNISGQDIPLRPTHIMAKTLNSTGFGGYGCFLADFGSPNIEWPQTATSPSVDSEIEINGADVKFIVAAQAMSWFEKVPGRNPVLRPTVHVTEDFQRRALRIRPLNPVEADRRKEFFSSHPFRFGRQWIVASRDYCEHFISSADAGAILGELSSCFIPDESFFQMAAATAPEAFGKVKTYNYRFDYGAPARLTNDRLAELSQSDAFFARKVDFAQCDAIDQWIDEVAMRRS